MSMGKWSFAAGAAYWMSIGQMHPRLANTNACTLFHTIDGWVGLERLRWLALLPGILHCILYGMVVADILHD